MTLGLSLKSKREKLNVGQREVARLLNVSQPAYLGWEKDRQIPTPDKWKQIAEWLDLDLVELTELMIAGYLNRQ